MQIWLPPSEGKSTPTSGEALDFSQLSIPELTDMRRRVTFELQALSSSVGADSVSSILGLGAKSQADIALNDSLFSSPCAPMEEVFTGVLFNAAALADIDEATRASLRDRLTVFSGAFGALRFGDLIPDHRLSMGVKLPHIGNLVSAWKPVLEDALKDEYQGQVVLDMRSGPYRSACPAKWAHVWQVGVVREVNGKRSVVSHNAKYWRGILTGYLLRLSPTELEGTNTKASTAASAIEEILHNATALPPLCDAKGVEHRITAIELSDVTPNKQGGSTRTITLVTD